MSSDGFAKRIERLRADLVEQGRRVQSLIEGAYDALFQGDAKLAAEVVAQDDVIDRVDVEIEKACVRLLGDVTRSSEGLDDEQLRTILTIVKVNNEFERAADRGVDIAEHVEQIRHDCGALPDTLRVMANSVVGIIRDTNAAYAKRDPDIAMIVLRSEDTVEAFRSEILKQLESQLASGSISVETVFALNAVTDACERMADYCTNIAEQVIYSTTGKIVRHTDTGWIEVAGPDAS